MLKQVNASNFIWTGDCVYSIDNSIKGLEKAYSIFKSSAEYSSFASSLDIDGVWDDHGSL